MRDAAGRWPYTGVNVGAGARKFSCAGSDTVSQVYTSLTRAVGCGRLKLKVQRAGQVTMDEYDVPDASSVEIRDVCCELRDCSHDMFEFQWETAETGTLSCPAASKSSTGSDVCDFDPAAQHAAQCSEHS